MTQPMPAPEVKQYDEFVAKKLIKAGDRGFDVPESDINPKLFDWQRAIVIWALRKGCAALFEDCGLGKTAQQLEWAHHISRLAGGNVLILAPLAVAEQTKREAFKFEIDCQICESQADVQPGINITNYEKLEHFEPESFVGIVLDESSILKSFSGITKRRLIEAFAATPYKLACTATPAPNDYLELGNHAQFLGIMESNEMISRWFINDSMQAGNYRVKAHAEKDYWLWVASWAICIENPADLGFCGSQFILPNLELIEEVVSVDIEPSPDTGLFPSSALTATSLYKELRLTSKERARRVARLVEQSTGQWIIWVNTNDEADQVTALLPEALEVRGDDKPAVKTERLLGFASGDIRILVTKPSIAGFGMNWQGCAQVAFLGLSYSYEQFYQAVRRCWRYGQANDVKAYIVISDSEGAVLQTIRRKERDHEHMKSRMVHAMREMQLEGHYKHGEARMDKIAKFEGRDWTLYLGDCVHVARTLREGTVDYSVFSPPFSNLYIYSDSPYDMGNTDDDQHFLEQFGFMVEQLYRITRPGRCCSVHCKDLPRYKGRDGEAGLRDFPGELIRLFTSKGWSYHSRVTIWKDPVIEMQRTKNHGLLYKQLRKDSTYSRQGMADYVITFRKWAEVDESPVTHTKDSFTLDQWQQWASPVWMNIAQTKVLNYQAAKEAEDERHICPLQLEVIERCIKLWSNPGDLVFSPFAGIGSEGYEAILAGRRFIGAELKTGYVNYAVKNLAAAAASGSQDSLFAESEDVVAEV
jgi:superfamily II DNA or RNA helicase